MIEALIERVRKGESENLEYKTSTSDLKKSMRTVCAFLNQKGGEVLIGFKNNGQCVGQMVTDNTRREIARELSKIEPYAHVEVEYVSVSNSKDAIILHVEAGRQPPYIYDGRPYERVQSETRQMSQHRYDQLVAARPQLNYNWERFPAKGYAIKDLDEELITGVVRKAVEIKRLPETALRQDINQLLESLELIENGQLNNAAIVLFGKRFTADFLQCKLKLARFKGKERHEFLDNDLVTNNIFELLEAGLMFVRKHLPLSAKIVPGQLKRVEKFLIPFDAIRETLINALAHRDYSNHTGPVGVAIYDNYMEIFNEGGLLHDLTLEKIKSGFSKPRNKLIANVLYRCNMIEAWGRGIKEIIQSCMDAGDPEPEFFSDNLEFKVLFPFSTSLQPPVLAIEIGQPLQKQINERQQEIIDILIKGGKLKLSDINMQLTQSYSERTLRNDLSRLKNLGMVDSEGKARATVWFLTNINRG